MPTLFPETPVKRRSFLYILLFLLFIIASNVIAEELEVATDRLNLRTHPDREADVIAVLEKGSRLQVISREEEWVKVSWRKTTGYLRNRPIYIRNVTPIHTAVNAKQNIETEINNKQTHIDSISREETNHLKALDRIEKKIAASYKRNTALRKQRQEVETRKTTLRKRKVVLGAEIESHREETGRRLTALYRIEQSGWLPLLSPSRGIAEFIETGKAISSILKQDQEILAMQSERLLRLEAVENKLETESAKLRRIEELLSEETANQISAKKKREALISRLRSESRDAQLELKRLVNRRAALESTISKIKKSQTQPKGGSLLSRKGLLAMPVNGTIQSRFGTIQSLPGNGKIRLRGINITAELGDPIRAVYSGKVVYADWLTGYGNMIIIDHGQQLFTVYAHAEELFKKPGDPVEEREVIATIGESGSLSGPMLHFEIRQKGNPVDPMGWLRSPNRKEFQ